MKQNKISLAGVILAGGLSSRMQQDKKFLKYQDKTFLDLATFNLKQVNCEKIFLSLASPATFATNLTIIQDELNNIGPIAGVFSTLNFKITADYILFLPVDMPLLSCALLECLTNNINNNGVNYKDYVFPFIVKNNETVLDILQGLLNNNCYSLKKFLNAIASLSLELAEADEKYLKNINYYEQFLELNNVK